MGKKYKQNCSYCKTYYEGEGKMFCSALCRNRGRVTLEFRKKISIAQKKAWTPERRKLKSEFNKSKGIRPPGFSLGHRPWNTGGTSWNKGIPRSVEELKNIKLGIITKGKRSGSSNPNWRGGKKILNCLNCNKIFTRHQSSAKTAKYCSYVCAGIYRASMVNPKSNTLIERLIEEQLVKSGLQFLAQKRIYRIAVADFYLPNNRVAIFCDGDYWHRLPGRQEDDKRKTKEIEALGIKVFRFWEKDIKLSPSKCVKQIINYVS